jgi:hypothetical protein
MLRFQYHVIVPGDSNLAIRAGQRPQVAKQARAFLSVRQRIVLVVDKGQQFVAGHAVGFGGPIAAAIRRLDGGFEFLPVTSTNLPLFLMVSFSTIEKHMKNLYRPERVAAMRAGPLQRKG